MRRALSLAVGLIALCGPALAADRALAELVGYSADGRYFAFEEYGVHDGSGAPYAGITVIDLDGDMSTRLAAFEETGGEDDLLPAIRTKVRKEAAAEIAKLKITEPAQFVSMVGDGVAGADGFDLRFGTPGGGPVGEVFNDQLLKLSTFATTDKTGCSPDDDLSGEGLALDIVTTDGTRQIFSDGADTLPTWRNCPIDYRLYAVVLPYDGDIGRAVALISLYRPGWEGADRTFMALPLGK